MNEVDYRSEAGQGVFFWPRALPAGGPGPWRAILRKLIDAYQAVAAGVPSLPDQMTPTPTRRFLS